MRFLSEITGKDILIGAGIAFVFFGFGWYGSRAETLHETSNNEARAVRYNDAQYPFISPLVSVAMPNGSGFSELAKVKRNVSNIAQQAIQRGDATDVGVYFRLPNNAHWFGINEDGKFSPGSLIKVPIMLAFLKQAENDPGILKKPVRYDATLVDDIPNALKAQLPSGQYSAEKLLNTMIVNSDNIAKEIIFNLVGLSAVQDVFDETSSNFLQDPSGTISPKQYIIILARIYSATYLDRQYSNYAMGLLNQTTFKDGLVAGLPEGVKVAHKYGESAIYQDSQLVGVELHDCGLVYAENNPYYLCVMTKGKKTESLANVIKDISSAIYKESDNFKPAP